MNDLNVKYPRTWHCPFSPGASNDDKVHKDMSFFEGKEIVITLKMDGENTSMTSQRIWARSLDSVHHVSRSWVKAFWASIKNNIPEDFRLCGENLYAKHAIHYQELPTYFIGFNIWEYDLCLPWDETVEWFTELGIPVAPVLYRGPYNAQKVLECATGAPIFGGAREGIVGRLTGSFLLENFTQSTFKWVRKGHVTENSNHWMYEEVIPNLLKSSN